MDDFDFPDVYVSEEFLRQHEQGELLVIVNSNISTVLKSITLKYDEINSFQDLLTLLFNYLLVRQVSQYSYGSEWILSKYDGIAFTRINKHQRIDTRSLFSTGLFKNDILLIQKL